MIVDTINTKCGEFKIGYTKFKNGFYIDSYPKELNSKSGLTIRTGRDNCFDSFTALKKHIDEVVHNFYSEFNFTRKVICYYLSTGDYLYFKYMICNESEGEQLDYGTQKKKLEYYVLESDDVRNVGRKNIFPQLTSGESKNWVIVDYDEKVHVFIVDFLVRFNTLKENLKNFFGKEDFIKNVLSSGINLNVLKENN